jgi:DNA repair protein RecO (recombination protein O)
MRVLQQPAYVIHHHDYSETSLLLELFTRDHGRVGVIAKGARRAKGDRRALLNPFTSLRVDWSGKGDLGVLGNVEADGRQYSLSGESLYCGFYINELILRLLHRHDAHERLFSGYRQCLDHLHDETPNDVALRRFEALLLQELGYGLVLDHDAFDNMPVDENALYEYVVDSGPRRVGEVETNHSGALVHGRSLIALSYGQFSDEEVMQELKRLMRVLLARHLGDRPLNSRKLFQSLSRRQELTEREPQS